jgi:hypothetical protein
LAGKRSPGIVTSLDLEDLAGEQSDYCSTLQMERATESSVWRS